MKKIHVLCNDGSPLRVTSKSIYGDDGRMGVGGAELALLTMCEGWHRRGYDITLYNNPDEGGASIFPQKTLNEFDPHENRDHLIIFRSPNERARFARGKKTWFSCDQMTVGDFKDFSYTVNSIVVISKFHAQYFKDMYGIDNVNIIDLPVRVEDYEGIESQPPSKKCIYTSIPDRGVMQLHAAWAQIVREVPDASLVLTSDWRLWNHEIDVSCVYPFQLAYAQQKNVAYVGAVPRRRLIQFQTQADLLLYPCTYDELFCIAVAEAQVAGAIPVTSQFGAVRTTNEFGYQIEGSPYEPAFVEKFVEKTVSLLRDPDLQEKRLYMRKAATER